MNAITRMFAVLLLVLFVMGCSEHDDSMNPTAADATSMQKKPPTTVNGPVITSVTPGSAEIGDEIVIKGQSFGPKYKYTTNYVTVCGIKARVYALWSKTEIHVTVPSGSILPNDGVTVTVNDVVSNKVNFTILPSTPIIIGNQTWAGANLDVETYRNNDPILYISDSTAWANATEGAWCYYDFDPDMGTRFGKLYNWYAVNDPRGLAPSGQHIPTDAEWTELAVTLGASYSVASQAIGFFGTDEGGKLREVGSSTWSVPNEGATNSSGFTALPGGYRSYLGGYYGIMYYGTGIFGLYTAYWSKTEAAPDPSQAWYRLLDKNDARLLRSYGKKGCGFSVRTIYD